MGLAEDRRKWNRRYAESNPAQQAIEPHPLALQYRPWITAGPMLDVACGLGRGIAAFHDLCNPCIGVDLSDVALREARATWCEHPQVHLLASDVMTQQWSKSYFVLICAFGFTDWRFFARIPGLLRPGGVFLYEGFSRRRLQLKPDMDPAWTSTEADLRSLAPGWPVLLFEEDAESCRNRFALQRPFGTVAE